MRLPWSVLLVVATVFIVINIIAIKQWYVLPGPLDKFQRINTVHALQEYPMLWDPSEPLPSYQERAVVTTLYSESYTPAVLALGHSLRAVKTAARRIVLYIEDRLSPRTLCDLEAAGWETRAVPRIAPPNDGKGVYWRFADQYTKLRLWGLDREAGIKAVVYLDADTLVRRNFDELWSLTPFAFAAVPDVYLDARGLAQSFNAGVMFLRTSSAVLEDMLSKIGSAAYSHAEAEQGFLNMYFAARVSKLPYVYNANLALKKRHPELWHAMKDEIRIVHYTLVKPFDTSVSNTGEAEATWKEEISWWNETWDDFTMSYGGAC